MELTTLNLKFCLQCFKFCMENYSVDRVKHSNYCIKNDFDAPCAKENYNELMYSWKIKRQDEKYVLFNNSSSTLNKNHLNFQRIPFRVY